MEEVKVRANEIQQAADVREYLELLKELTTEEKREVRGIMIGLKMSREQAVRPA